MYPKYISSTEGGITHAFNGITGEEIWSVKTGSEVLFGLAIPEDFQDPRCGASTIHFMDEMIMMDKIFEEMFDDEEAMEKADEDDDITMEEDDEITEEQGEFKGGLRGSFF